MTSNDDFYNDVKVESDYVKWGQVGTTVRGVIVDRDKQIYPGDTSPTPVFTVRQESGDSIKLSCGPSDLKAQILNLTPGVGDNIEVTFSGVSGKKKLFKVNVAKASAGESSPTTAQAALPVDDEEFFG